MATNLLTERLRSEIAHRYLQKYGDVQISFDTIQPVSEQEAKVQFTISDAHGFITRYYGRATYQDTHLHLEVASI